MNSGINMSIFSSYKKIFLLGFIVIILLAIPFSVYIAQQRQNISSKAALSTTLSFDPATVTEKAENTVTLNVMLDPGTGASANQVSFVKLSIKFDQTKFTVVSLEPNTVNNTLKEKVEEPQYDNTAGKASISLSIGADPANVLKTKTKIAILQLKPIAATAPTSPNVTFDTANTQVLSVASADQTSENVLSTTTPATVTVTAATATSASSGLICSGLSVDRSTTGNAPYSLTLTVIGSNSNGTINKVSLNFGDGPIQDLTTGGGIGTNSVNTQISHTYNNAGTYSAYAILTDNNGNLSAQQNSCTKSITVNSGGPTGTGSGTVGNPFVTVPTQEPIATNAPEIALPPQITLPPTGPGAKILGIGAIGVVLTIIGGALLLL